MLRGIVLVGSPGLTTGQVLIGIVVVLAALLAVGIGRSMASGLGLPTELARIRDQARGSKADQTPTTRRFSAAAIRNGEVDLQQEIVALFEEGSDAPDRTRDALAEARTAIGAAWQEKTAAIPSQALALAEWGVLVAIFGAVAVSTGLLVTALEASPTYPTLTGAFDWLTTTGHQGVDLVATLLTAFPYFSFFWSLGFAYGLLVLEYLYYHWFVLAGLLLVASVAIGLLERRVDTAMPRKPIFRRRTTGGFALGSGFLAWLAGSLTAQALRVVGLPQYADPAGLGVATAIVLTAAGLGGYHLVKRIDTYRDNHTKGEAPLLGLALLRAAGRGLRGIAILFVGVYLLVAILDGRLLHLLGAFRNATIEVQVLVALGALAVVGLLAYEVRAAWPDVREALEEMAVRQRVRAHTFAVGVPVLAVGATYAIAWAFQRPLWVALLAAVFAGVVFRLLTLGFVRVKYRRSTRSRDRTPSGTILVQAYSLDTDAGTYPLVTIGSSHQLAHETVTGLAPDAADVVAAKARGEDPPATVTDHFADHLLEYGIHDIEETQTKLRERVRKRVMQRLRAANGEKVYRPEIVEDDLGDVPSDVVDERLAEMAPWVRDTGRYLELVEDIYPPEEDTQRHTADLSF